MSVFATATTGANVPWRANAGRAHPLWRSVTEKRALGSAQCRSTVHDVVVATCVGTPALVWCNKAAEVGESAKQSRCEWLLFGGRRGPFLPCRGHRRGATSTPLPGCNGAWSRCDGNCSTRRPRRQQRLGPSHDAIRRGCAVGPLRHDLPGHCDSTPAARQDRSLPDLTYSVFVAERQRSRTAFIASGWYWSRAISLRIALRSDS